MHAALDEVHLCVFSCSEDFLPLLDLFSITELDFLTIHHLRFDQAIYFYVHLDVASLPTYIRLYKPFF